MKNTKYYLVTRATQLTRFILGLYEGGHVSRSVARNALDRLAIRMECLELFVTSEYISGIYMTRVAIQPCGHEGNH
jgi:hypothetical protein